MPGIFLSFPRNAAKRVERARILFVFSIHDLWFNRKQEGIKNDNENKNRSLVQKVFTETCRGAPLELKYYRLWEEAPEGPTRYGAAIEAVCNGEATRAEVPDVTSLREEIDHLLWKLARGTVTPESLREVIEDSL